MAQQAALREAAISNFVGEQLGPGGFDRDVLVRLCKLATMVEGCMSQYMQFFRAMATTQVAVRCHPVVGRGRLAGMADDESGFLARPSRTERHRIQRAMIRFEMMCRLFTIPFWQMLMATSADKKTSCLAEYGQHDFKSDRFLWLIEQDEVDQLLSVAAFVRAQFRCMLGDVRRDFEEVARSAADELFANPTDEQTHAVKYWFRERSTENRGAGGMDGATVEYLLHNGEVQPWEVWSSGSGSGSESDDGETAGLAVAAEEAGVAAGVANIASGFGLGLMGEFLGMGNEERRRQLMDMITAVDQGTSCMEVQSGYPFDFLHVQSFPVVKNDQPVDGYSPEPEDDGHEAHPANGRLVGFWFWDRRRTNTDDFQALYEDWMIAKSPVPSAAPAPGKTLAAQLAGWYGKKPSSVLGSWWITYKQWVAITEDFRVWKFRGEEGFDPRRLNLLRAIVNKALGTGDEASQN